MGEGLESRVRGDYGRKYRLYTTPARAPSPTEAFVPAGETPAAGAAAAREGKWENHGENTPDFNS